MDYPQAARCGGAVPSPKPVTDCLINAHGSLERIFNLVGTIDSKVHGDRPRETTVATPPTSPALSHSANAIQSALEELENRLITINNAL